VVVAAVDILPSELPREASRTFGDCLCPLLPHLLTSKGHPAPAPTTTTKPDALCAELPPPLQGATIAAGGGLTAGFEYISFLRAERERERRLSDRVHRAAAGPTLPDATLKLTGHLFDSGLINQVRGKGARGGLAEYRREAEVCPLCAIH
jgi:alpha-aminoadipic semialdehyde synthase